MSSANIVVASIDAQLECAGLPTYTDLLAQIKWFTDSEREHDGWPTAEFADGTSAEGEWAARNRDYLVKAEGLLE